MNRIRPWLKNTLVLNVGLKFLALLMAIFTFHSIRTVTSDEAVHIVPVEVQLTDANHIVTDQDPLSVTITLRGSREDLKKLDPQDIKAILKLRKSESGSIPIRARDIRGVSGLRVVKIEPDKAAVTVLWQPEEGEN